MLECLQSPTFHAVARKVETIRRVVSELAAQCQGRFKVLQGLARIAARLQLKGPAGKQETHVATAISCFPIPGVEAGEPRILDQAQGQPYSLAGLVDPGALEDLIQPAAKFLVILRPTLFGNIPVSILIVPDPEVFGGMAEFRWKDRLGGRLDLLF